MESVLRTTPWILERIRNNDLYAEKLYAVLCNNKFVRNDIWAKLKNDYWSCNWREAGSMIAEIRNEGDYIDWYCSVIKINSVIRSFDPVSIDTEEIRKDLLALGWATIPLEINAV